MENEYGRLAASFARRGLPSVLTRRGRQKLPLSVRRESKHWRLHLTVGFPPSPGADAHRSQVHPKKSTEALFKM